MGSLVSGKTLGIIGLGTIGKKLVEITKGLQLKYLAFDLIKDEVFAQENNVEYWDLSYLLENADIISIHLNMTKEKVNLINMNRLKKMKPSSKIIITLPLILPPFLNISGYLAAIISLFILSFYSKEGLNSL